MTITAGLDVGGAHLKVALVENGVPIAVQQFACPLWQGLDRLDHALVEADPLFLRADRFALTMTGELSDLFPDRATGVATLLERLTREIGDGVRCWLGARGFGTTADARAHPADVGSTNFLATATLVARHRPDALLIDFGSTTADIIPIAGGKPVPQGFTDAERQTNGELVYTGFTRTAVMGIARRAPLQGRWVELAREYLATMADVRRILGELPDGIDLHATADGRGKSFAESLARLARMLGRDAAEAPRAAWIACARHIAAVQMRTIEDGAALVLSHTHVPIDGAGAAGAPFVAAGIGAPAIEALARQMGFASVTFGELCKAPEPLRLDVTRNAPAVAVALLAS